MLLSSRCSSEPHADKVSHVASLGAITSTRLRFILPANAARNIVICVFKANFP